MPGEAPRTLPAALHSQRYYAPRELEHPLQTIRAVEARTLVWIQPQPLCPAYELWAGEEVVATLRYRSTFQSGALGAAADGVWKIEEVAGASGVRLYQGERIAGTFLHRDAYNGLLSLEDGRTFLWVRRGVLQHDWAFMTDAGQVLLHFTSEAALQARSRIRLLGGAREESAVSLLALLGQYLMLRSSSRSSEGRSQPGGRLARS